ncbi:MAG: LysM peptidoglycan-binding domain-containing protein [Verrucomicrobiota bacterium]
MFCVIAINVLGLTALLMQGCKREQTEAENPAPPVDTNAVPAVDTNLPPVVATNPPVTPPPMVTPAPAPESAAKEYIVVKGDTFSGIAKKFGVTVKAVEAANPGVEPTKLKVGQKLSIPAAPGNTTAPTPAGMASVAASGGEETYTVKSGDTLSKIAKATGATVKAIESENNLTTTQIKVGQKLKIPAKAAVATPAPEPAPATAPAPTTPAPAPVPGVPPQP